MIFHIFVNFFKTFSDMIKQDANFILQTFGQTDF